MKYFKKVADGVTVAVGMTQGNIPADAVELSPDEYNEQYAEYRSAVEPTQPESELQEEWDKAASPDEKLNILARRAGLTA